MDTERLVAAGGGYAPTLLYGSRHWRPKTQGAFAHQHLKTYALLGVQEGAHQVLLGSDSERLTAGECCLLLPDRPYRHRLAPGAVVLYAVFTVTVTSMHWVGDSHTLRLGRGRPIQPQPAEVWGVDLPHRIPRSLQALTLRHLTEICDSWWRSQRDHFHANASLAQLLHRLVSQVWSGTRPSPTGPDELIARLLADCADRTPPVDVAALADRAGLHRNQLTRRFKEAVGIGPGAWLRQARLARAHLLLETTDHPISSIASDAGYRDSAALDHAFTAAFGCPPGTWRRRHR